MPTSERRVHKTLSATIGPLVALVSAAMTTPPSNMHPTIVVPVLVALGKGTPCACKAALRLKFEKSKPGIAVDDARVYLGIMQLKEKFRI